MGYWHSEAKNVRQKSSRGDKGTTNCDYLHIEFLGRYFPKQTETSTNFSSRELARCG